MEKISVIIPIYNVSPYLTRCIQSVILQTYTNIEILLVNDASTDDSDEICRDFLTKYKNIHYFATTENMGVAHARNVGLENATGSLVSFVDADDWIDESMYAVLHGMLENYDAFMATCNYKRIDSNDGSIMRLNYAQGGDV